MNRVIILLSLLISPLSLSAKGVEVSVDMESRQGVISPYLLGMHTVYCHEKDSVYEDGSIADWAKRCGVGTMRYPGGTIVKYWDWENPTGEMRGDPWNPEWDKRRADPKEWMSLDEYLEFVDRSGITPLFGVNYRSGHIYNRTEEGIARAVRMVQYVKDYRGGIYAGKFWYIGNEDMHHVGGIEAGARLFVEYARAMKEIDPEIKIFFNQNSINAEQLKSYLSIAGEWVDGVEFHGKWPLGGEKGSKLEVTFEQWQDEIPLLVHGRNPEAWRDRAVKLRAAAAEAGYPDLLLANNEYGIGKPNLTKFGFDRYTIGLLLTDFTQEFIIAGYDMSAFWSNLRGDMEGLFSARNDYRPNPVAMGWELIGCSLGGEKVALNSSERSIYGYAALNKGSLYIYLLNKSSETYDVDLEIPSGATFTQMRSMEPTADKWGQIENYNKIEKSGSALKLKINPLTYNLIEFKYKQ